MNNRVVGWLELCGYCSQ